MLGESSLAAPICDARGDVIATVAVVFATADGPAPATVLTALRDTARNVSRELGGTSWPPRAAPAQDRTG